MPKRGHDFGSVSERRHGVGPNFGMVLGQCPTGGKVSGQSQKGAVGPMLKVAWFWVSAQMEAWSRATAQRGYGVGHGMVLDL